ncbi:olfactory receptor 52K1-like [Austrofundulus limnaeus]|uniref:Olfactory receptor 52K1-like n=1 Tax=Austrofundulus limnaeus TaxID=52670 RepID=A0A2I4CYN8_AUSLI|nr:PREDICTED: olfactory receptor 52K1-like [Austrofundulus limnaeus]
MESKWRNISSHQYFIFNSFSDLGALKPLVFIPFFFLVIVSLFANSLLFYVIISQRSLHSPMFILIACMMGLNLSPPLLILPYLTVNLLFDMRGIYLSGCLAQMFCIYLLGTCQSTVLVLMALDRYFAICKPLHYQEHLSLPRFLRFVIPLLSRNVLLVTLVVSLAGRLPFCFSNVINHCICEHMALVELACGSTAINSLLGSMSIFLITVLDFCFISISYVVIFYSVLRSGTAGKKALHTCITHIIVMIINLAFVLATTIMYRIRNSIPDAARVFLSVMYLFFPSCFNPIIYGFRTTEIRQHILKTLSSCRPVQTVKYP